MHTPLTKLLAIKHPIIQAPLGSATTPELAAAVSNAGGLGMLALSWADPAQTRAQIRRTKALTDRPFGVNLVLAWDQRARVAVCADEGVAVVSFCWGDAAPFLAPLRAQGIAVCHTVGSADEAARCADQGVDFLVAQGWEAGGHVGGRVATSVLVPAVADRVALPVVAAGGIADGRGIVAALSLGAAGVWMGTRFLLAREAATSAVYRAAVARATENDTVYAPDLFHLGWEQAPHRVLRNSTVAAWERAGSPPPGHRPGEGQVLAHRADGSPVVRYSDDTPLAATTGDLEALALYAGQSAGLVHRIAGAADIVQDLVRQTEAVFARLTPLIQP